MQNKPIRERIRESWADLSASERRIAGFVLDTYPRAAFETVNSLGELANTSGRSVVRFFEKLEYSSFADLKNEIQRDIERRLYLPVTRFDPPEITTDGDGSPRSLRAVAKAMDNVNSIVQLEPNQIVHAAETIARANRVYIFGSGKSVALAIYLWFPLMLTRKGCQLLQGSDVEVIDQLIDLGSEDLVITFDFPRYPQVGFLVSSFARSQGAHVVTISSSAMSPSALDADVVLVAPTPAHETFDSYVAAVGLIDVLAEVVSQAVPRQEMVRRLRVYEQLADRADFFAEPSHERLARQSRPSA